MPCIAFDYEPASGVHRVACPAASGARYELRETKGGKLVTRLAFTRPDAATIALVVPGRFLSGNGPIRWRAYFVGPGDTLLDTTRWGRHAFAD